MIDRGGRVRVRVVDSVVGLNARTFVRARTPQSRSLGDAQMLQEDTKMPPISQLLQHFWRRQRRHCAAAKNTFHFRHSD